MLFLFPQVLVQFAGIVLVRAESESDLTVKTQEEKVVEKTEEEQEKKNEEGATTEEEITAEENSE